MEDQVEKMIIDSRRGDRHAFAGIYDLYSERIFRYIYYKTYHNETAEDLTSRTFMKVLEKLDSFKFSRGTFSSWLYRVARNQVIDHFRVKKQTRSIHDIWDLASGDDIERDVLEQEKVDELHKLLKKLKPLQREIVMLRVWQNLSYNEISEILGKSEASCKMMFSRVLLHLKEEFTLAIFIMLLLRNRV